MLTVILIGLGFVVGVFWVIFEIFSWTEGFSVTLTVIKEGIKKYKSINELYQCQYSKCERIYRRYQATIYEKKTGRKHVCPHCETNHHRQKIKDEKWWRVHPDCPKISWISYMKLNSMIKKIKKNEQDIKAQEFFEEYNKIKVDFNWIENLQKKYK